MARDPFSDGFVNLCIDPNANWLGEGTRVLIEGQMTGTAVPANVIVPVTGERDIDANFGQGSVLSESLKYALAAGRGAISLYALPRADEALGVAAVYTLTVAGPATTDGRVTLYAGEAKYNIDVHVDAGDSATTIAALVQAEVHPDFPYTATVVGPVITLTAKNKGTVGNDLEVLYNWAGRANYAPGGVTFTLAQTTPGSIDPAPNDYAAVIGDCYFDIYALSSGNVAWQENLRDYLRDAWSCDKPQSFGHGYVYNEGTLGQVLATGDNSGELNRVAVPTSEVLFPYLITSAYAALTGITAKTNPELSIQGRDNGLLSVLRKPQSCSTGWTWDEVQNLQEQGFVVYGPASVGTGQLVNPFVYNDVTNYLYDDLGRANTTYRDTASRRMAFSTAMSIADELQKYNGLALFTRNTQVREGVRGTNVNLITADLRAWAQLNVGVLFSEFDNIDEDLRVETDAQVKPPCTGKPGTLHVFLRYRPPVRIDRIFTTLRPEMLDNCNR